MAYMYPYGDSQQLNLSWFLAKFKELYEYVMQLDPSGETAMDVILSRFTEQYDSTKTYIPGDYCIYDGYIYKANTTTRGTFNSSAWDAALPVNDVQGLRILLGGLSTDLDALEQNAVTNVQYTPGAATADGLLRQTKNGTASTVMTVDKEPTENSQNPVKSGGVYDELTELKGSLNTLDTQTNSVEWTPASGDTLLAFLIANITNRNRLPFSFVKRTNNTVSDVPTNFQSIEFTGVVFGSGDRITVLISKYGSGNDEVYIRNIYQSGFYGTWLAVNIPIISNISAGSLLTAGTHVSIGGATYYKIGQIVCWEISLTTTGAVAVGETLVSGLNTPFFPANGFPVSFMYDQGNPNEIRLCRLNSSGNLESCVAISSSGINIRTTLVYAASA